MGNISPRNDVSTTWVPDDDVVVVRSDPATGITYVGGFFESWGPNTGSYALVNQSTGSLVSDWENWAKANDYGATQNGGNFFGEMAVCCAAPDGSGGWYIGGQFTRVGGLERWSVAHINSDGSVDEGFNAGRVVVDTDPNDNEVGSVIAMANLGGGLILVGGNFGFIGGQERQYLAILNSAGAATEPNFNLNGPIYVISSGPSGIYVGGEFTSILGQTRRGLARLTGGSSLDTGFDANIDPLLTPGVYAIHDIGSRITIGGSFSTVGGDNRQNLAFLNPDGTSIGSFANPQVNSDVYAVYDNGTTIYAGGTFSQVGLSVVTRNNLAAFDTSGTPTSWDPNANSDVYTMYMGGGGLFIGGDFTSVGGATRQHAAQIDPSTGAATAWDPHPADQSAVRCIVTDGTDLLIGGNFNCINAVTTGGLAAVNLDGTATALRAGSSAVTRSLLITEFSGETKLLVGESSALLMMDTSGNIDWSISASSSVLALHRVGSSSTFYAGGAFTTINSTSRSRIAELNLSDGSVTGSALGSFTGSQIRTITSVGASPTHLYIGGTFTVVNGSSRNNAAKVTLALSSTDSSWDPNLNSTVNAILSSRDESTLYVAGSFTTVNGGTAAARLVGVDTTNGTYTGFNPTPGFTVDGLALNSDGTRLYLAGSFEYTDAPAGTPGWQAVAECNVAAESLTYWRPNLEEQPPSNTSDGSFADADSIDYNPVTRKVSTGGGISDINGLVQPHFAQWFVPYPVNIVGIDTTTGNSKAITSVDVAVNTAGGQVFGSTGSQGITGLIGSTGYVPAGPSGATGLRGATGLLGAQGLTGLQSTGIVGITGLRGDTGPQVVSAIGETGLQGATGLLGFTGLVSNYVNAVIFSNYTATASDYAILVATTSGAFTITLPLASSVGAGKTYKILPFGLTTTSAMTITTSGSDLINGLSEIVLPGGSPAYAIDIYSNGNNYFARGRLAGAIGGTTGIQGITGIQGSLQGVQGITGVEF